jgi:hypothetical protein
VRVPAFGEFVLVVSGAGDPATSWSFSCPPANCLTDIFDRAHRRRRTIDIGKAHSKKDHVVMSIVKPGHHTATTKIDTGIGCELLSQIVIANCDDSATQDCDCRRSGLRWIKCVDVAVDEELIDLHRSILSPS